MSGDLDEAIARGATHLRIGSAVLGAETRGQVVSETPATTTCAQADERPESRGHKQ